MYYLLDCLYCNLHRKIIFFFLPAWKIQHLNWLKKWDSQMCAVCKMSGSSYQLFLLPFSTKIISCRLWAFACSAYILKIVWLHLVRKECFKKGQSAAVQTMSEDMELDWGAPPRCVGKPRAQPGAGAPLAQIILEWWYFLGIYMALCLVFPIPLLKEHKHFLSVWKIILFTGHLTPHLFVDVCPVPRCSDAVQLRRPFRDQHQIVLFLLAHLLCFFALTYFWW